MARVLRAHGLAEEGEPVAARIPQLYLVQNQGTEIPVVVLEVNVPGHPGLRMRSQ